MARGAPDGKIDTYQYASQFSDPSRVADVLWGFSSLDGRGRIVYFDTFNNGLNGWRTQKTGAGILPALSNSIGFTMFPPNCVSLNPGTVSGDTSEMYRVMHLGKSQRIGIEAGFYFNAYVQPQLTIDYNPNQGNPYYGRVRFENSLSAWQVLLNNGTGTYQTFNVPGVPPGSFGMFMQVKLVMDFSIGKYVRALIGDEFFDLSAISMSSSTSSYNGALIANVRNKSLGAGTNELLIGYVLITRDEP